jgi:hypothetical protein
MKRATIGLRAGETPVTVAFGEYEIVFGITEFRQLMGCAAMDLRNASDTVRRLDRPVELVLRKIDEIICHAPRSVTAKQDEAENLARWQETGHGGVFDLTGIS